MHRTTAATATKSRVSPKTKRFVSTVAEKDDALFCSDHDADDET